MSIKQKRVFWLLLALGVVSLSALGFASARRLPPWRTTGPQPRATSTPSTPVSVVVPNYVRSASMWPQLRWNLKMLGDRLENPGKERVTLTGTLSRATDTQLIPVVAILELPNRLNLTMQTGGQTRVLSFNGSQAVGVGGAAPNSSEQDLIETLVYDTADRFFLTQMQRQATRTLGHRLRADNGSTANYPGPLYDVYEVFDQVSTTPQMRTQTKRYLFNSQSLLLERVQYSIGSGGSAVLVEIRMSDWQQVQGQQIPTRITRLENNQTVLTLTITSVVIGAKASDGLFG